MAAQATGYQRDRGTRRCSVRSIGEWTAHYIAIRLLREPDAFTARDVELLRACTKQGYPLTFPQLQERAERWRPRRACAAMHLWTSEGTPDAASEPSV